MLIDRETRLEIRKTKAFKFTNHVWNMTRLNRPWTIGHIMKIADGKEFRSYEEWENYYLNSGEERKRILKGMPQLVRLSLENLDPRQAPWRGVSFEDQEVNMAYGRTVAELRAIGSWLYDELVRKENPYRITKQDCFIHVFIRVIDESFIGMRRENMVYDHLVKKIPSFDIRRTSFVLDKDYGVDAEVYDGEKLVCGIQIKSEAYRRDMGRTLRPIKELDLTKNLAYSDRYGVPVLYVYEWKDIIFDDELLIFLSEYEEVREAIK